MFTIENGIATVKINRSLEKKENGLQNIVAKYFSQEIREKNITIQNTQNKNPKPDSQQTHIGQFTFN